MWLWSLERNLKFGGNTRGRITREVGMESKNCLARNNRRKRQGEGGREGGGGRGKKNICVTEIVEWFETSLYSQRCSSRSVKLRGHCTRTMCIPYVGNYWNNGGYSLARSINATMVSTAMIKFYEIALSNSKWERKSEVVEKWLKDRIKF